MAYLSLYRKYRPQNFSDVIGQDHVVQTLQNALRHGRIAHGYLFCGTRGVAKTTIARIFAKCLNCVGPDGKRTTPTAEPCNQCEPCQSITAGQCVDVVEMDAASNRSVTDIARLRENVRFGPMESRYKTYIVDEAHQLSSDAKDAFLKTLEEPPPGVVFILATTELHSIPFTIASRCQRFDFHRGTQLLIADQIARVLAAEEATLTPDAVAAVARAAEGSYRDALSLLDQVIAYKRQDVNAADVADILGVVESQTIDSLVNLIVQKDAAAAFGLADDLFTSGKDIRHLLKSLAMRFRDLLYVGSGAAELSQMAGDPTAIELLQAQAKCFKPEQLIRMADLVVEADRDAKYQNQHKLILEMALLKLMYAQDGPQAIAVPANAQTDAHRPISHVRAPLPPVTPPAIENRQGRPQAPMPNGASTNAAPLRLKESVLSPGPEQPVHGNDYEPPSEDVISLLTQRWTEVVNQMSARSPASLPVIKDAGIESQQGNTLVLSFSNKWNVDKLDKPRARAAIEEVINRTLRAAPGTYRIQAVLRTEPTLQPVVEPPRVEKTIQQTLDSSPLLDEVIAVFGGKIIEEQDQQHG
jgi:DNA polymerase-3 subunit gamma/tau